MVPRTAGTRRLRTETHLLTAEQRISTKSTRIEKALRFIQLPSPMHLFEPIQIRDLTFKHRVFVSPMCQYSSHDGFANDWHLVQLGRFAVGGASLVITEANAVTADGRISPSDVGIW